jgi:outer membrane protein TolC
MLSPVPIMLAALLAAPVTPVDPPSRSRAEDVVAATCDPVLANVLRDVLASSPALAASALRSSAAAARAAGAGSLPDPMLSLRTTTDRGGGSWDDTTDVEVMGMQSLPARSRRRAMGEQAQSLATSAAATTEAARLDALGEASRWYFELARLDALDELRRDERATLRAFAESARGRYASGAGRQQDPIRAQAEVSRNELILVEIDARRREALAALNELRGRGPAEPLQPSALPQPVRLDLSADALRELLIARSPALDAAESDVAAARAGEDVARKASIPDISLGGFYELMDAGGGLKVEDRDQFGVLVGISLPVRHRLIAAGVDEAVALRLAAVEQQRAATAVLTRHMSDALVGVEEARNAWDLHDQVLGVQAEESLRSALSGYSTGVTTSLDVIDSLRVTYEVRAEALRARADFAIEAAKLRSMIGGPLACDPPCAASAAVALAPITQAPSPSPEASGDLVASALDVPQRPRHARLPRW